MTYMTVAMMAVAYGAVAGLIRIFVEDYAINKPARTYNDRDKK